MVPILVSGVLPFIEFANGCSITPLIPRLGQMTVALHNCDFTRLKDKDINWKLQTTVPQSHAKATLAALLRVVMHAPDVMQYLGDTYTDKHSNIKDNVAILAKHDVDPCRIAQYV